jgi:hypothetical protein
MTFPAGCHSRQDEQKMMKETRFMASQKHFLLTLSGRAGRASSRLA